MANKHTPETIFRKVYRKDRLPEKEAEYFTDCGELPFYDGNFRDEYKCVYIGEIHWWLEEIELPSEEDIIRKTVQFVKNELCVKSIDEVKESEAIELIKGGKLPCTK